MLKHNISEVNIIIALKCDHAFIIQDARKWDLGHCNIATSSAMVSEVSHAIFAPFEMRHYVNSRDVASAERIVETCYCFRIIVAVEM